MTVQVQDVAVTAGCATLSAKAVRWCRSTTKTVNDEVIDFN